MIKVIITNAIVSNGYNGAPALKYSEKGDSVRFRIGQRVYDTRAENNTRWMNLTVKAFSGLTTRIQKMQMAEGAHVNLTGRLDEETWQDKETGQNRSQNIVILDDIEYCGGGSKQENNSAAPAPNNGQSQSRRGTRQQQAPAPAQGQQGYPQQPQPQQNYPQGGNPNGYAPQQPQNNGGYGAPNGYAPAQTQQYAAPANPNSGFTGYESYGTGGSFY